ncbi:MAG: alpha-hydroxy acid oxidase [Pseudolabrys sp.]|nr:alpha-hydroxy acid oxidase [Pseudolabrys sp.]MDP2297475.1 alpha-hydroxy acid oxidase [Pseudolabrys sp.]
MPVITNVEDLRQLAKRKVPKAIFEYIDHGSYDQLTLKANRNDLDAVRFRQRVLIDADNRSLATTMLGEKVAMPVAIAPTGLTGLMHGDGEMLAAKAAEAAGIRFTLSTMSICSIEDIRSVTKAPFWFQLYVFKDRGFSESVIERAKEAGCSALFLTVDLPMRGQRHCDIKNGLSVPPRLTARNAFDIMTKPRWLASVLMGRRKSFGNVDVYLKNKGGIWAAGRWGGDNFDKSLSWDDVTWIRKLWPGKLVIKGILDPEDAKRAADMGAEAIVVSNHGGRQLDGVPGTITALPRIADAVRDRMEVLFDGGIRSGLDVLKALALGAHGCLIGRAYLYGLAAMGEAGVAKALSLIADELRIGMSLTGVRDVADVSRDILFDNYDDPRRNV